MEELITQLRLPAIWAEVVALIKNPYSNLLASLLLVSAVVAFVLLVATSIMAVVSKPKQRASAEELAELQYLLELLDAKEGVAEGESAPRTAPVAVPVPVERPPARERWLMRLAGAAGLTVLLWMAIGATTSTDPVCTACHEVTSHSEVVAAGGVDPHQSTECVSCHESSGLIGRVTVEPITRIGHFINGARTLPEDEGYGAVASASCRRCHEAVIDVITEDEERGVRMSHLEPVDAGAKCTDCHTLATGVVSSITVGMTPCLRCHDGEQQSTECSTCHTKDVSAATRVSTNLAKMEGRVLIPTPDCGSCHQQETQCDPCHGGIRMPHSDLFMWWGHARKGAEDLWFNNGEACSRCHYEERRPCTGCHAFMPGHPVNEWKTGHAGDPRSCGGCHNRKAHTVGRDICGLCHGEAIDQ